MLSITLAMLTFTWTYATLHPSNAGVREQWPTWIIANILFFGAIIAAVFGK